MIGQAGTDRKGRGRLGARFLEEARDAIEGLVAAEGLDFFGARDLTLAYAREEVEAPDVLFSCLMDQIVPLADPWWVAEEVDAEIDRLRQETNRNNWLLHSAMADQLATLSTETRVSFVRYVAYRDEDFCGRLALYWLLDTSADVRLAAAGGFQSRVRRGVVEPVSAALVPLIRDWMPPDAARAMLDDALREARRHDRFAPLERPALLPVRLLTGLPDRSGAQVFAAILWSKDDPGLAMVSIEPGYGIRRASVATVEVGRLAFVPAMRTSVVAAMATRAPQVVPRRAKSRVWRNREAIGVAMALADRITGGGRAWQFLRCDAAYRTAGAAAIHGSMLRQSHYESQSR